MNLSPGGKEVSERESLISTSLRVEIFVAAGRILYSLRASNVPKCRQHRFHQWFDVRAPWFLYLFQHQQWIKWYSRRKRQKLISWVIV